MNQPISRRQIMQHSAVVLGAGAAEPEWVVYEGYDAPGYGRHVVLVSGDEEYRSEEAFSQLGKILAQRQGFKCTVLFAQDPAKPRPPPAPRCGAQNRHPLRRRRSSSSSPRETLRLSEYPQATLPRPP